MPITKSKSLKVSAKVFLIVLILSIAGQFLLLHRTHDQLTSPLIPPAQVTQIMVPYYFSGFVSSIMGVIALLLYFFEKYLLVIILVGLTLIWQQLNPFIAGF